MHLPPLPSAAAPPAWSALLAPAAHAPPAVLAVQHFHGAMEVFESDHSDTVDVSTIISHCDILSLDDYLVSCPCLASSTMPWVTAVAAGSDLPNLRTHHTPNDQPTKERWVPVEEGLCAVWSVC